MTLLRNTLAIAALLCAQVLTAQQAPALDSLTRGQLHAMLRNAHEDVAKYYYDPHFHGVDMDALYKKTDPKLDTVQTLNQGFAIIEGYLDALHDSSTYFLPPSRTDRSRMNFRYQMIGDRCFITHVKPGTDAAKKLRPGDEVLKFNGFKPERNTFLSMDYYFTTLATLPTATLVLRDLSGAERTEVVQNQRATKGHFLDSSRVAGDLRTGLIAEGEHSYSIFKPRFLEAGNVIIWKLPDFDVSGQDIDEAFLYRVRNQETLILDLRGAGRLRELVHSDNVPMENLKFTLGHLFDQPVTIASVEARKSRNPEVANPHGHKFKGKILVLIDSGSESTALMLARVLQLEHRGTVIGDISAGSSGECVTLAERSMNDMAAYYAFSIAKANLIMTDGQSLEKHGVVPDEVVIPTAADLAAGRDPVLERAVTEAGGKYDADAVAKAFPYLWPLEDQD